MDKASEKPVNEISAKLAEEKYNATVHSIHKPHSELMILRIVPDAGSVKFEPGQYATLGLGFWEDRAEGTQEETEKQKQKREKLAKRPESFSHPVLTDDKSRLMEPDEMFFNEFLMNLVKENPEGTRPPELTPRLYRSAIQEGSRIFVDEQPKGVYMLKLDDPKKKKHILFGATGTGEAPHNAMIWKLLREGYEGRITSIVCDRYRRDLAYEDLNVVLQDMYKNYTYIWLTTREAENLENKMYVQDLIMTGQLEDRIGEKLNPETMEFYLCGNDAMIGIPKIDRNTKEKVYPRDPKSDKPGVIEALETQHGFEMDPLSRASKERGNIHFEKWY